MKAIVYENYGGPDVLKMAEVPKPSVDENDVLIRVIATSVTTADCRVRSLNVPRGFRFLSRLVFGFNRPRQKILGTEFAGIVEKVGPSVRRFKMGDEVIAQTGASMQTYAEYCCLSDDKVILPKPRSLSFEEAAVISFGAHTAWSFLVDKVKLNESDTVLINGASGSVGSAAIQVAKNLKTHVTAVCSEENFEFVKSLGADQALCYKQTDFSTLDQKYDFIIDAVGNLNFSRVKNSLSENGNLILVSADLPQMIHALFNNLINRKKIIVGIAAENKENLQQILNWVDQKKYRSVVDRVFSMSQIVEAHAYVEKRHRRGNIAIRTDFS